MKDPAHRRGGARAWPEMAPAGQIGVTLEWVSLRPESVQALEWAIRLAGGSRTDTVNRALQLYAILLTEIHDGGGAMAIVRPDGTVMKVDST